MNDTVNTEIEEQNPTWQFGIEFSSMSSYLFGGDVANNRRLGVQLKRTVGHTGLRLNAQIYPNSDNFSSKRVVQVVGEQLEYLHTDINSTTYRLGFGIERSQKRGWGQSFYGLDLNANYLRTNINAWTWIEDPTDPTTSFGWEPTRVMSDVTNGIGPGLAPFIGYDFYPWRHIGVTLEAKIDFNLIIQEGFFVADNGQILRNGVAYNFRTFPLLTMRVHYRS